MNIEELRAYCLTKPMATEDFPFDETTLVVRVMGKMFALIDLNVIPKRHSICAINIQTPFKKLFI